MDHQIQYPGNMAEGTLMPQNDAVKLTPELIDSFEAYMKNKGMDQGSIKSYRQAVEMLYQWLPEEKVMDRDTLRQWSEKLVINRGGGREIIRLPKCLCQELLSYAKRSGITTGPLFLTRQKKPMRRTQISDSIRRMCLEAKIPEGKGNPRCLRKLYKETMRSIYANMDFLFAKAYEQILDQEQLIYGWEESV